MQHIFLTYILFFSSFWISIHSDHVPTVLWNIKGTSVPLKPLAAFDASNGKYIQEFLQSTLKEESTSVVVYVADKLSMEDLASESQSGEPGNVLKSLKTLLDGKTHIMVPSAKDPVKHFRSVACGVKDIHAGKRSGENFEKSIEVALEDSCIVIVHLGSKGLPLTDTKLALKTSKKNVVGVFTASKSSWHPAEELHRRSRSLFAAEKNVSHFMNISGCIYLYAESFVLALETGDNVTKTLDFPPATEAECGNDTSSLTLTFAKTDTAPEVILKMKFVKGALAWRMINSTIQVTTDDKFPKGEYDIKSPAVDVPMSFSYSCGAFRMRGVNITEELMSLTVDGFQIQPYDLLEDAFTSSFNCVPWFTLPIWMGIFVALLFIAILNTGVFMLFNIKTMDRFDDPKGKTISVTVGD